MASKKAKQTHTELERGEITQLVALEDELHEAEQQYGVSKKEKWWVRLGDGYFAFRERHSKKVPVRRKTYCWLCLLGIIGAHHFYARHWVKGILYLLISWTGISAALGLIDAMVAIPMKPDENGMIEI